MKLAGCWKVANADRGAKRKGHPGTGQPFLLGRIVPTEGEALTVKTFLWRKSYERRRGGVKRIFQINVLYNQLVTKTINKAEKFTKLPFLPRFRA
jgi:hypothetical protein